MLIVSESSNAGKLLRLCQKLESGGPKTVLDVKTRGIQGKAGGNGPQGDSAQIDDIMQCMQWSGNQMRRWGGGWLMSRHCCYASTPSRSETPTQRWRNVGPAGPTLHQRWVGASCFLGRSLLSLCKLDEGESDTGGAATFPSRGSSARARVPFPPISLRGRQATVAPQPTRV